MDETLQFLMRKHIFFKTVILDVILVIIKDIIIDPINVKLRKLSNSEQF